MKITVSLPSMKPETIEVNENIKASDILENYKDRIKYPIYACKVNNCYRGLNHILRHDSKLEFLDMTNQATWIIYQNSLELLYMKAVHDVCGKETLVTISNSLNKGLYTLIHPSVSEEVIKKIEDHMFELVKQDLPIKKEYLSKDEAIKLADSLKLKETKTLLQSIKSIDSVEIFSLDDEIQERINSIKPLVSKPSIKKPVAFIKDSALCKPFTVSTKPPVLLTTGIVP